MEENQYLLHYLEKGNPECYDKTGDRGTRESLLRWNIGEHLDVDDGTEVTITTKAYKAHPYKDAARVNQDILKCSLKLKVKIVDKSKCKRVDKQEGTCRQQEAKGKKCE